MGGVWKISEILATESLGCYKQSSMGDSHQCSDHNVIVMHTAMARLRRFQLETRIILPFGRETMFITLCQSVSLHFAKHLS